AERVERRVEAGNVVALGREVHVTVGRSPADGRRVQLLEEEKRDDVHRAERRAEVPGACTLHGHEGVQPAHVSNSAKAIVPLELRVADSIELLSRYQLQLGHVGWRR